MQLCNVHILLEIQLSIYSAGDPSLRMVRYRANTTPSGAQLYLTGSFPSIHHEDEVISLLIFESTNPIPRRLGRRPSSKQPSRIIPTPPLPRLQFNIRPMGMLSIILDRVPRPTELALPPKRPRRSVRQCLRDKLSEEGLQDRDAGADETRVDLDDAPEERLGRDPGTVDGGEVTHRIGETDDGDGPVSKRKRKSTEISELKIAGKMSKEV